VAALHDLSGVGRCALTVAIPVISAMGLQVIPAPTAVLSAHTAFPDFVGLDLTDYLESCLEKWCEMGMKFDCIYTGYMASIRQEEIARRFMDAQPEALKVVDPVLGDDGVMYRALPKDMPEAMKKLCRGADVITPNWTEALLLTGGEGVLAERNALPGTKIGSESVSLKQVEEMLDRLMQLGPKTALLTGAVIEGTHVNAWMTESGKMQTISYEPVHASFPGTGDIFASVLVGALMQGKELCAAVRQAADFTCHTIAVSQDSPEPSRNGVAFEKCLGKLAL
jgi:pyridoxine kinase